MKNGYNLFKTLYKLTHFIRISRGCWRSHENISAYFFWDKLYNSFVVVLHQSIFRVNCPHNIPTASLKQIHILTHTHTHTHFVCFLPNITIFTQQRPNKHRLSYVQSVRKFSRFTTFCLLRNARATRAEQPNATKSLHWPKSPGMGLAETRNPGMPHCEKSYVVTVRGEYRKSPDVVHSLRRLCRNILGSGFGSYEI